MNLFVHVIVLLACALATAPGRAETGSASWALSCQEAGCTISATSQGGDTAFLLRGAGADTPFAFGLRLAETPDAGIPVVIAVDGGPKLSFHPGRDIARFAEKGAGGALFLTEPELAGRILAAMRGGSALRVHIAAGGRVSEIRFALDGFAAGLKRIADKQNRSGDDLAVAPPQGLTRIDGEARPPVDAGTGPRGLPASVTDRHQRETVCEDLEAGNVADIEPVSARMSATATVYALPCTRSDAGVTWRLYRSETGEIGGVAPMFFARHDLAGGWTGTDLLWNAELDGTRGVLTSRRSGQGDGDCGYFARWRWQANAFVLEEVRQRAICNSAADAASWPLVYRRQS